MKFGKYGRYWGDLQVEIWPVEGMTDVGYSWRGTSQMRIAGGEKVTWTETFNCDLCGKQKGSVDHWWLAWSEPYSPHPDAPQRHLFKIYPWENMLAHDATVNICAGRLACKNLLIAG